MRSHPRIGRVAKWAGIVICMMIAAANIGSLRYWVGGNFGGTILLLVGGAVEINPGMGEQRVPALVDTGYWERPIMWPAMFWRQVYIVPLWCGLLPMVLVTALAWRAD